MAKVIRRGVEMLVGAVLLLAIAATQGRYPLWGYLATLFGTGFVLSLLIGEGAGSFAGLGMVACAAGFLGYDALRGVLNTDVLPPFALMLGIFLGCISLGSFLAGLIRKRVIGQESGKK